MWAALIAGLSRPGGTVVAEPPGSGPGYWAGGPSAVWADGAVWLSYRLRRPVDAGRGYANVVARAEDGVHFNTVCTVSAASFGSASLERPALVQRPDGGWRLYVSCSTFNSLHWWVEAVDADRPEDLPGGLRTVVLPGDAATAWKDPVVHAGEDTWSMWVCRHAIADPALADQMDSWYATSADGLEWQLEGAALEGQPGGWDQRGARVTSVLTDPEGWLALYDGRADFASNWEEQTGVAVGSSPDHFESVSDIPLGGLAAPSRRYVSALPVPEGGWRLYYECTRPDGAHELRTEYVPRSSPDSQSG